MFLKHTPEITEKAWNSKIDMKTHPHKLSLLKKSVYHFQCPNPGKTAVGRKAETSASRPL